jgi:hypothetical protein
MSGPGARPDGFRSPVSAVSIPCGSKWRSPERLPPSDAQAAGDTVVYVDAIPRTSVGKIDKKALRAAHADTYRTTA